MTDERRRDYEQWHLDKRLNVGHLLTTIVIAGSIVAWGHQMDQRVTKLEVIASSIGERIERSNNRLERQLESLNNKLDALLFERHNGVKP